MKQQLKLLFVWLKTKKNTKLTLDLKSKVSNLLVFKLYLNNFVFNLLCIPIINLVLRNTYRYNFMLAIGYR